MSRGKRYDSERKLNYQKVFAVILAIIVTIMLIFMIKNIISEKEKLSKNYEYFALFAKNKWGIINQNGEEVIAPTYQEMIVVPNKNKDVFLCIYDVNEENGTYKTKAINSSHEEIFTEYDQVEAIENIDENDNSWFEKNILKVKKDGKYGLIDLNGKELIKAEYDEITVLSGIENSIIIKKDGKVGLVNDNGSIIIEPKFKEIKNLGNTYKNGYITIDEQGKYGVVSATKKQILNNEYNEIKQSNIEEDYLANIDGKIKLIDSKGNIILEDGFDDVKSITTNGVIFTKGDFYGEKSKTGETLIEAKYQFLEEVKKGVYIAKKDDKYGIIDNLENEMLSFQYVGITYNQKAKLFIAENSKYKTSLLDDNLNIKVEGILSEINIDKSYIRMRVNQEYRYYNLKGEEKSNTELLKDNTLFLSQKDGKYGFVDKKGNVVIDYIYDDATEQNEYGFSAVKKDGLWGSIDKNGKEVIKPKYSLENNLKIDFIGKWHLGEDLNMNYYCEK